MREVSAWMAVWVAWMVLGLHSARAVDPAGGWTLSLDLGGNIPEDASLSKFNGPPGDNKMKLDPGFQMDVSAGYRFTPWLQVGPELGFTFNGVDKIGGWSYPNTTIGQVLMMMNVRIEYPPESRLAPFVGAGVGGAASFLTFGSHSDYYYYDEPDGTASDLSLAFQAFGGVRYRFGENFDMGIIYRYLQTDNQQWDVDWWTGAEFRVGIDSLRTHSVCLLFSARF